MSSFASVNGPSTTVRLLPEKRTRAPFELAWSPSPASRTPAFANSSLNFPISVSIFSSGRTPASVVVLALTITMNRMSCLLYQGAPIGLYSHVEWGDLKSTTGGWTPLAARDRTDDEERLP